MIPIDQSIKSVFALATEDKNKMDTVGTAPSAVLSSRESFVFVRSVETSSSKSASVHEVKSRQMKVQFSLPSFTSPNKKLREVDSVFKTRQSLKLKKRKSPYKWMLWWMKWMKCDPPRENKK